MTDPTLPNTFPAVADNFRGPCMYEVRPEWRSGRGRWWRALGQGYTDDVTQAGIFNDPDGVSGSERSYAVSADLVRSCLTSDPTLPGIPNDAIAHAENVERAREILAPAKRLLAAPARARLSHAFAEALTAAELRGFAAGVESTKPVPVLKQCRSCRHDHTSMCGMLPSERVRAWCAAQTWTRTHTEDGFGGRLTVSEWPSPDADNCPGWAPRPATETT